MTPSRSSNARANGHQPARSADVSSGPNDQLTERIGALYEPLSPGLGSETASEPLAQGGTHLLDLVASVDYLSGGLRPGLTVWDALEEALRWWLDDHPVGGRTPAGHEPPWNDPDPLRSTLTELIDTHPDQPLAPVFQQAVRRWALTMATFYNRSCHWPHPAPRRSFPPPLIDDT